MVIEAGLACAPPILFRSPTRQRDDLRVPIRVEFTHVARDLISIHIWHPYVEQNNICVVFMKQCESSFAVQCNTRLGSQEL